MATKINFTTFDGHVVYKEKLYHKANTEYAMATVHARVFHPEMVMPHFGYKIITPLGEDGRNCVVQYYNATSEEECTEANMICYIAFAYEDKAWVACPSDAWRQIESYCGLKSASYDEVKRVSALLEEGLMKR